MGDYSDGTDDRSSKYRTSTEIFLEPASDIFGLILIIIL